MPHVGNQLFPTTTQMTPVVNVRGGVVYANSRDVAVYFEKRNADVLRDIDNLLKSLDNAILRSAFICARSGAEDPYRPVFRSAGKTSWRSHRSNRLVAGFRLRRIAL